MNEPKEQKTPKTCALYGRTAGPGDSSIERQLTKRYAAAGARGWIVSEEHVFSDDGQDGCTSIRVRPGSRASRDNYSTRDSSGEGRTLLRVEAPFVHFR
jgi:hypothetical protein